MTVRTCIGYSLPMRVHQESTQLIPARNPCYFSDDGKSKPAEALRNLDTCIWCCGDNQKITEYYSSAPGLRYMRKAYSLFSPRVRILAAGRVAAIPFVGPHILENRPEGICIGTENGTMCEFSRTKDGDPVDKTGMRCLWCRPNLELIMRHRRNRFELRKTFNLLRRQFQLKLLSRLPMNQRHLWQARSEQDDDALQDAVCPTDYVGSTSRPKNANSILTNVRNFFDDLPYLDPKFSSSSDEDQPGSAHAKCKTKP